MLGFITELPEGTNLHEQKVRNLELEMSTYNVGLLLHQSDTFR